MPMSSYLRALRERVGNHLLVLPSVSALIFDERGDVLLARHADGGVWATPGGAVEPEEQPYEAVIREVREETSLVVEPIALRGVFGGPDLRVRYPNGDETSYVTAIFECRVTGGTLRVDDVEILEARFVPPAEVMSLSLAPFARSLLPTLLAQRGATHLAWPRGVSR